jgi:2-polyprenyl-6-methoxyphenol hydroxylase-like FAD-dependent oxidoreductase
LADSFGRVIVVERDEFEDEPEPRAGVPQGRQIHTLLVGGRVVFDELFPGFSDEMMALSAPRFNITSDGKRFHVNAWTPRFESDLWTTLSSRALLEWVVRRRVLALPNVEVLTGVRVTGLVETGPAQVGGVRLEHGGAGATSVALAKLVVDTTGRSSHSPQWLAELGYDAPEETLVNGFWGYAGRYYQMPSDLDIGWLSLTCLPAGSVFRGAVLQRHEGDRWQLTLMGCARDHPPADEDGFASFASSLPIPDFSDVLSAGDPLTPISSWRQTANRFRRYHELTRRPDGFILMGDAVATFNPVYGQGMTVAALEAKDLQRTLADIPRDGGRLEGFADRFQATIAATIVLPWALASGADHAVPGSTGSAPSAEDTELMQRWQRAMVLANEMPEVTRLRFETQMLLRSQRWLYEGQIADRLEAEWDRLGALLA